MAKLRCFDILHWLRFTLLANELISVCCSWYCEDEVSVQRTGVKCRKYFTCQICFLALSLALFSTVFSFSLSLAPFFGNSNINVYCWQINLSHLTNSNTSAWFFFLAIWMQFTSWCVDTCITTNNQICPVIQFRSLFTNFHLLNIGSLRLESSFVFS